MTSEMRTVPPERPNTVTEPSVHVPAVAAWPSQVQVAVIVLYPSFEMTIVYVPGPRALTSKEPSGTVVVPKIARPFRLIVTRAPEIIEPSAAWTWPRTGGLTVTSCSAIDETPYGFVTFRVTWYVPGAVYCFDVCQPSP